MTYETLKKHADEHGYELSEHAEAIFRMITLNDGKCPCKKDQDDQICPCPDHHDEIAENNKCTCSLFIKS